MGYFIQMENDATGLLVVQYLELVEFHWSLADLVNIADFLFQFGFGFWIFLGEL